MEALQKESVTFWNGTRIKKRQESVEVWLLEKPCNIRKGRLDKSRNSGLSDMGTRREVQCWQIITNENLCGDMMSIPNERKKAECIFCFFRQGHGTNADLPGDRGRVSQCWFRVSVVIIWFCNHGSPRQHTKSNQSQKKEIQPYANIGQHSRVYTNAISTVILYLSWTLFFYCLLCFFYSQ